jgi:DTW domain-containing protein YfiP
MCSCDLVVPFEIGFELAVLMHPKEARVAIGTGRLVHRMIARSHLIVGEALDDEHALGALLERRDLAPLLLFPREDAIDLDRDDAGPRLKASMGAARRALVLIPDGTWTTAKKLLRLSERLQALPALRFQPPRPSRYGRLRKEPRAECWSTLESGHRVVELFAARGIAAAPEGRAHDRLLALMDDVVARQLVFEPPHRTRGRTGLRVTRTG